MAEPVKEAQQISRNPIGQENQQNKAELDLDKKNITENGQENPNGQGKGNNNNEEELEEIHIQTETGIENPKISRKVLFLLAEGSVGGAISKEGEQQRLAVTENKNLTQEQKNQEIAMGYDLEIGGLQLQIDEQMKAYNKASGKKKEKIKKNIQNLSQKLTTLKEERSRIDLPNQLADFAKAFGVTDEDSQTVPLLAAVKKIQEAETDPEMRKKLIENLRSHPDFSKDDAQKAIDALEDYLLNKDNKKEKRLKKIGEIALMLNLMTLIMVYQAQKKSKEGTQY